LEIIFHYKKREGIKVYILFAFIIPIFKETGELFLVR
jgi:hypothetical protein